MLSPEEVIEIDSSDKEKIDHTVDKTIIIEDDNRDKISPKIMPAFDQVSTPKKNITITVEDGPDKNKVNSTKIVIAIDDVLTNGERSINIIKARNDIMGSQDDYTLEFLHFIELCLKLERSDGMIRIIQRNLIPNYKAADKSYLESTVFRTFLDEIISKIIMDPMRKFSCMKQVSDMLKAAPRNTWARKRVGLVTLDKTVSDKAKTKYNNPVAKKRRIVDEVIDLDKIDDSIIDVDAPDPDDVILVVDEKSCRNNNHIKNSPKAKPPQSTCDVTNILEINEDASSPDELLKQTQIKRLEDYLVKLKATVKQYEEMEVVTDGYCSPYVVVDNFKLKIIQTYKELCQLTGEEYVPKPKQIKICAPEGHPAGPALRLERWLNSQAVDGDFVFPDFIDVVKCVTQASEEDGLGWTNHRILHQARSLFTQCGQALQLRRQRREWRDLASKVESPDPDPAETDPALEARLQENSRLARSKEERLLQHYATMANNPSARNYKKKSMVIRLPESLLNTQSNMIEIEISGEMAYSDKMQESATLPTTSTTKEVDIMFQENTCKVREIASMNQDNTSLDREMASNLQENTSKDRKIVSMLQDNTSLDREMAIMLQENTSKDREIVSMLQDNTSLDREMAIMLQENTSKDREIVSMLQDNTSLDREMAIMLQENTSKDREIVSMLQDNTSLDREMAIMLQENTSKDREIVSMLQDNTSLDREMAIMLQENTSKNREIVSMLQDNTSLDREMAIMLQENTSKDREYVSMLQDNTSLDREMAIMLQENTSKDREIVSMLQDNTSLDREMAIMMQENTGKDKGMASMSSQMTNDSEEVTYSNLQENANTETASDEFEEVKPLMIPRHINPETVIVCSDSEDYSSTDDDLSDFELDAALNTRTEELNTENNRKNIGNMLVKQESKDDTENVCSNINKMDALFTASPTEINEKELSQIVPRESNKKDINIEYGEEQNVNAEPANECVEENSDDKAEENEEMVKVKLETNTTINQGISAEDTLKMLLSIDKTSLENGSACITSTIFDIEEPIMFIEISSSESESDDDS